MSVLLAHFFLLPTIRKTIPHTIMMNGGANEKKFDQVAKTDSRNIEKGLAANLVKVIHNVKVCVHVPNTRSQKPASFSFIENTPFRNHGSDCTVNSITYVFALDVMTVSCPSIVTLKISPPME